MVCSIKGSGFRENCFACSGKMRLSIIVTSSIQIKTTSMTNDWGVFWLEYDRQGLFLSKTKGRMREVSLDEKSCQDFQSDKKKKSFALLQLMTRAII